jgi:chromosome partitioning protein
VREPNRATAITVINLKGGVGKTHTIWLLAGLCEELGLKCLAVDLDQQGNLSRNLRRGDLANDAKGAEVIFAPGSEYEHTDVRHRTKFEHVDFVPAGPRLQPLDEADQKRWEDADMQFALVDFVRDVRPLYDVILFDCPTKLSLTGLAALTASDFAIVPLEPADWGAQGVAQVTEAIEYVKRRHNPRLQLLGYVISRLKRRKFHRIYAEQLRQVYGDSVFDTEIPDLAGYEQAVTHAIPSNLRRPKSKEAEVARQFFSEVQRRIEDHRPSRSPHRRRGVPAKNVAAV